LLASRTLIKLAAPLEVSAMSKRIRMLGAVVIALAMSGGVWAGLDA
jgi:hypothetical protein